MKALPKPKSPLKLIQRFRRKSAKGEVWHGDAVDFLRAIPTGTADLVFLDLAVQPWKAVRRHEAYNRFKT